MPFGLTNAPVTFEMLMNKVFGSCLGKLTLMIFWSTQTAQDHLQYLEQVFKIMRQQQLYAKKSKFEFMTAEMAYSGLIISKQGVAVDSKKDFLAWTSEFEGSKRFSRIKLIL